MNTSTNRMEPSPMTSSQEPSTRRPILVPVDFTAPSRAALMYACRLAQRIELPVLVLHVLHESPNQAGYYRKHDSSRRMLPLDEVARDMVADMVEELKGEDRNLVALDCARTLVVPGLPADRIPEVAEREGAAMIIIGTHGRNGLSRLFNGSVTKEVSKRSAVPVTIIKLPGTGREDDALAHTMESGDWRTRPQPAVPPPAA